MFGMRTFTLLAMLFGLSAYSHALQLHLIPHSVSQGQVTLLRAEAKSPDAWPETMSVAFGEQVVPLWTCGPSRKCGLVAIPYNTSIGKATVKVTWRSSGTEDQRDLAVVVRKGKFKVNRLKVDPSLTSPSAEDLVRIDQEKKQFAEAYASGEANPIWKAAFVYPTKASVTSRFGNQRTYNGQVQSVHFGVDLRANEKTAIQAMNDGRVLLAGNFFYAGNMVLIDHGAGLFSSYSHLSTLDVQPGAQVAAGAKLGFAGATGRVTGPHLHWGIRVNGVPVEPLQLLATINKARFQAVRARGLGHVPRSLVESKARAPRGIGTL